MHIIMDFFQSLLELQIFHLSLAEANFEKKKTQQKTVMSNMSNGQKLLEQIHGGILYFIFLKSTSAANKYYRTSFQKTVCIIFAVRLSWLINYGKHCSTAASTIFYMMLEEIRSA